MGMKPVSTFLSINRAVIGAYRADWVFMGCRCAAQRLDPSCQFHAVYDADYERVGWCFTVRDQLAATRLHICYTALLQGRGLRGLLP